MVTCTTPPFRAAVRLNSGVRPVQNKCRSTSGKPSYRLFATCSRIRLSPQTPCRQERRHSVSGFGISQRAVVGARLRSDEFVGQKHGWHRSNNSFKPSPLRGLVQVPCKFHLPKAAQRSGLTQALDGCPSLRCGCDNLYIHSGHEVHLVRA